MEAEQIIRYIQTAEKTRLSILKVVPMAVPEEA